MKIGIFDSGIGGLSVLHQAMIIMPEADFIFYADVVFFFFVVFFFVFFCRK